MRLIKFRRHKKLYQKVNLITVQFLAQPQTILHTSNCTPRRKYKYRKETIFEKVMAIF